MARMERSRLSDSDTAVFRQRAEELARPVEEKDSEKLHALVLVRLGTDRVGVPSAALWGLFDNATVTKVPGSPQWLAGLAQVRGELVSVMRLADWFGEQAAEASSTVDATIVVLMDPRGLLGVLVDEVLGFLDVREGELNRDLTTNVAATELPVSAVTNDLVMMLDVSRFMSDPRLIIDDAGTWEA